MDQKNTMNFPMPLCIVHDDKRLIIEINHNELHQ